MERLCQSCGMPMPTDELLGTNADGSLNTDYCTYCFQEGAFSQELTMNEMIEHCVQFIDEFNKDSELTMTREEAIAGMKAEFPKLKRWENAGK